MPLTAYHLAVQEHAVVIILVAGMYTADLATALGGAGAADNDIGPSCTAPSVCDDEVREGQDYEESELIKHLVMMRACGLTG